MARGMTPEAESHLATCHEKSDSHENLKQLELELELEVQST
jgi:hypothetical protein